MKSQNLYFSNSQIPEALTMVELAHELKLPLFNIKSFLETLYEYNFDLTHNQRLEFLEIANKETNRLINLINNIIELQVTRSSNSTLASSFSVIDLLSQVSNSYKLTAKNKNVCINYKLRKVDYTVYGNSNLIGQAINNLVGNSLKYTFKHKKIFIRSRIFMSFLFFRFKREKIARVTVIDQGTGLPIERVNEVVSNGMPMKESDVSTIMKGHGLGLHVVKHILHRHKSVLEIVSRFKKGSMIGFTLPFYDYIFEAGEGT